MIIQQLKERIASDEYDPDAPFCMEKSLCEEDELSRVPAKRAIEKLEKRGLLSCKRGVGSFIVPSVEYEDAIEFGVAHLGARADCQLLDNGHRL